MEARSATFEKAQVTFKDGVKATYLRNGLKEVLTADSLVIYLEEKRGEAAGHVLLVDPDGKLSAENLVFSWGDKNRKGTASNVHLDVAGVMMEAATAESTATEPPTLRLTDVYGTSCTNERTPLYSIRSPEVSFKPGKYGIIRKPAISFFGRHILTLPTQRFSLDPRVRGTTWPTLGYKKSGQLGLRWSPNFFIDSQTALSGNMRAFPGDPFSADLYVTRSFADPRRAQSPIAPRSELTERFGTGYLDNVRVPNFDSENAILTEDRRSISLGMTLNRTSLNDSSGALYTKAPEVVFEVGGPLGSAGYQVAVRAQSINRDGGSYRQRLMAQGTFHPAPLKLAPKLFLAGRWDLAAYAGSNASQWSRAEVGLIAKPAQWLTLGAGVGSGSDFGTAMFPADRLLIRQMKMVRADLDLGPTKISYLLKRDEDRDKWYREFYVSQVMGCLEAFVMSRQFPSSYQFGVTLRLDSFFRVMRDRSTNLKSPETPSGSAHELHR